MNDLSRRIFMQAVGVSAVAAGSTTTRSLAGATPEKNAPVKVISSANGRPATRKAWEMITAGIDTLDAVVEGVAIVEADADDTSVGYGGLPNERGVVELDAAVMHGPTHTAGAVAALQNIKHPAQVALRVLRRTDHVLLVGIGALEFARAHGFPEENLLTDKARRIWLRWKERLSEDDDWLPAEDDTEEEIARFFLENSVPASRVDRRSAISDSGIRRRFRRPTGTIHCAAINSSREISCTTTTSGLAFKIPGRVGDSPIIGAGLYCDNEVGSCGSTGRGEANLQNQCSFAAVELMRQGASPEEAGMEVLNRVARTTEPRLRDAEGRPDFGLSFYLLAKDGRHAGVSMWGPSKFAITDADGTRLEKCRTLYTKPAE